MPRSISRRTRPACVAAASGSQTTVVVDLQPGHGVLTEAEALGCDLIAMATHGRTRLGRLVLGSTADKVLRGTHVPLLLYRPAKVPSVKV